jgi:ubiquinone/menaquinone biosynthesis C-methylase UbiE
LRSFGVEAWPRSLEVVEIFCGRGSGIEAWRRLGFERVEGVDISENLLLQHEGAARLYVGDCRRLGLPDASRDVICVQGGLHHLPALPEDLRATVAEVWRVLRPGGRFLVVEPWATPFLTAVHAACRSRALRRASVKLDALACMIEHEREGYFNWLSRPEEISAVLTGRFETERRRTAWGKLAWIGRKPAD